MEVRAGPTAYGLAYLAIADRLADFTVAESQRDVFFEARSSPAAAFAADRRKTASLWTRGKGGVRKAIALLNASERGLPS